MNTITLILFSSLLYWNWGESSPQFHRMDSNIISENQIVKIRFNEIPNDLLEIDGTFYNDRDEEITIMYKLSVTKSGQSNSTSNQSGNLTISSNEQVVLSTITLNLNKDDLYKIKLQVFENNQLIGEDSSTFYGDSVIPD
jgi:hypothetical protein